MLDQKTDVIEYLNRIATVAQAFNKLTDKEKLELKNWIRSTVQEEIAEQAMEILDADKEEVENMVANITRTIEEIKEEAEHRGLEKGKLDVADALLDILDDETIAIKTGLPLTVVQKLRTKNVAKK